MIKHSLSSLFSELGNRIEFWQENDGLAISNPATGELLVRVKEDTTLALTQKIAAATAAQKKIASCLRQERETLLEALALAVKSHREELATVLHWESGKTMKEAFGEVDGSAAVLLKTIKDASLLDLSNIRRVKERPPVGTVGLITSFNFPMAVGFWTIAPAMLAANAVVWKPSEKTPLTALACKAVFDKAMADYRDVLQILIGGPAIGQGLVSHGDIGMISATGSVSMGKAIQNSLAKKSGNIKPPILELGGNNGAIIAEHISEAHLEWSLEALMNSFLGSTGQRCTNTRRLLVHVSHYHKVAAQLETLVKQFLADSVSEEGIDPNNDYGYSALIDEDAFKRFEEAKKQAVSQGGTIVLGARMLQNEHPGAYYVEPALALMPKQTKVMHEETFAPLLFVVPYTGGVEEALALVNAPANAGLVNAIYTQSQEEADCFAIGNEAGHSLINSAKGTGTPAHGMGFGGNKDSGCGEILNSADPLEAFTRSDKFTRIAQNEEVMMQD